MLGHSPRTLSFSFIFHFYSGVILEKDDTKSDDENGAKKKSRAAGPLEIVRNSVFYSLHQTACMFNV